MRFRFTAVLLAIFLGAVVSAFQVVPDSGEADDTRARFREIMRWAQAEDLFALPVGEIMARLGREFVGRPYVAGPLDGFGREVVVTRLDAFDCFTFVEAMLAMARGIASGDTTYTGYVARTEEQRYRNGKADGYCSRLHYFTEWIQVNGERGLVHDVTVQAGGKAFPKTFGFMSAHREAYPALKDDAAYECIGGVEADLNRTVRLSYIPQEEIRSSYDRLRNGDLVAMVTRIAGLDVTHTGLVYKSQDGRTGLLHASTGGGVKISPDLQDYVEGVRAQVGILVARTSSGG